ncbi:MAG TPA: SprB repeat-containing protein, partial [Cytophagaceae bacterium]
MIKYSFFNKLLNLLFFIVVLTSIDAKAQCNADVPVYIADLRGNPDSIWTLTDKVRNGQCCGSKDKNDRYIKFVLTLDAEAEGVKFLITKGAEPGGSAGYQIECGAIRKLDVPICLSGPGPHNVTFFKPGGNDNDYGITSIAKPSVSDPTYVSQGCTGTLEATGFDISTITWTSITPGATGDYNKYLNCTSKCSTVVVTAQPGYPAFVDYQVTGVPTGGCSNIITSKVVRVFFVNTKTATIEPQKPSICFGGINTTLTATSSGGLPPYKYLWSTGATTQSISSGLGTYW